MNILLITSEFPPFSLGGVSVHSEQLVNEMCVDGKDNKVTIITFMNDRKESDLKVEKNNNKLVVRVNIHGKIGEAKNEEEQYVVQNSLMRTGIDYLLENNLLCDIELITLHGNFLAETAMHLKQILKVPLVYHAHSTYSFDKLKSNKEEISLIASEEMRLCQNANCIIAVSFYLKMLIVEYFKLPASKIVIIGKGININAYDAVIKDKTWADFRILFVGRISIEKGIEVLLMALRLLLRRKTFQGKLYIVGSAISQDYLEHIKNRIKQLSLENSVFFLGSKTQSEIVKEFKASDLVVVPSHNETFGRVAIEAMAAKVPVIVADVGGLGPLVEEEITGFKFSDGDYIGLMNKILFVYNNPDVSKMVAERAYKYVCDTYTFEKVYTQTIHIYTNVIGGKYENISNISAPG